MLGFGLYIAAWMYIWNFLLRTVLPLHANSPAAQGLQHGF